jgi:uncharacterized protein with GYD domain
MVAYVVLANFTDQGIRNAKESPKRADQSNGEDVRSDCKGTRLDTGAI